MASEKLRQREVHKYYQAWLDSSFGSDSITSSFVSHHNKGRSKISVSKDKALVAFAQLGCLRLDLKRCIVTLISTDQQYILAEATKSLSLVSGDGDFDTQDEIWFGNASLPRSQGISGDALFPPIYTAIDNDASPYTTPALVIPDIAEHEAYSSRGYAGRGVSFYCGVPILTDSGIPIGVYTVTDNKPRNGLTQDELRFMHDMASTVMRHLETVSNEAARFRGETLVLGLGKFVSGAATMRDDASDPTAKLNQHTASEPDPVVDNHARVFKGIDITAADPSKLRTILRGDTSQTSTLSVQAATNDSLTRSDQRELFDTDQASSSTDLGDGSRTAQSRDDLLSAHTLVHPIAGVQPTHKFDGIFSRAATILQACVSADGVLFFDAVSSNATRRRTMSSSLSEEPTVHRTCRPERSTRKDPQLPSASGRMEPNASPNNSASEESEIDSLKNNDQKLCRLLGCAFSELGRNVSIANPPDDIRLTTRTLSKLIKLYPQGKLFSFHTNHGHLESNGDHLMETTSDESSFGETDKLAELEKPQRLPRTIAKELDALVSHAQNVVWLPLWDFAKQRWSAGLFLWSKKVDKLVTAQEDLVYLKAFANSVMVEVARRDATLADTAKATFIANISHELRTPLHGILGNLDILQDTGLTEFQHTLVTAIEICGRTLSDTIDHVLEYSKINQLSKSNVKKDKSGPMALPSIGQIPVQPGATSMMEEDFDLAAIVEEAVEATYASHTFQSTGRTKLRASSITAEHQNLDPLISAERLRDVQVITSLEYQSSWRVRSQPSAIRRIVTNIFGNALKYTDNGMVQVTLSTRTTPSQSMSAPEIAVLLSVRDTGRGMSPDFVRYRAFVPFSQESQFSTGTGLGLSIVQQIVRSLGGEVDLESDQGRGTHIRVFLNLPLAVDKTNLSSQQNKLSRCPFPSFDTTRMSMWIVPADPEPLQAPRGFLSIASSLTAIAKQWYGIKVNESPFPVDSDLVLYTTPPSLEQLRECLKPSTQQSRIQIIVLAANTIEKAHLAAKYSELYDHDGTQINVLSHPVGPFKLGKIILNRAVNSGSEDLCASLNDINQDVTMLESASLPANGDQLLPGLIGTPARDDRVTRSPDFQLSHDQSSSKKRLRPTIDHVFASAPPVKRVDGDTMERTVGASERHAANEGKILTENRSPELPSPDQAIADVEQRLRVLLVDDNDINLSLLKTCMKRAHIPFESAKDGLQATLAFENASTFDVPFSHVLMDISMPVMDGIQATREIRDFERRQHSTSRAIAKSTGSESAQISTTNLNTRSSSIAAGSQRAVIMALSGVAAEATQNEMLEAGADLFLPKPVKMKELVNMLRT